MARAIISAAMLAAAASAQLTSIAGLPTDASFVGGLTSALDSLGSGLATVTNNVGGLTATSNSGFATSATATGPTIQVPKAAYTAGISGSVISADACGTTYAIHCTNAALCLNTDLTVTATIAPSSFVVNFATSTGGASALVAETCIISGSSIATCAETITVTSGTTTVAVATTATSSITYYALPVQSGYVAPTGTCSSAATPTLGAAYTSIITTSSKGAAPTQAAIYKAGVPALAAAAVWAAL